MRKVLLVFVLFVISVFELGAIEAQTCSRITSDDDKKGECTSTTMSSTTPNNDYQQDGPEAKEIAPYLPYFPFKGIPRLV